jgi:hypothetical protein
MVDSSKISVVIQGPLHRGKPEGLGRCLASIRRVLPQAEVIVSTTEDEDLSGLPEDILVFTSPDAGAIVDVDGVACNVNRQIRTTARGVQAATREYILKFRSDHALENANICRTNGSDSDDAVPCITVTSLFTHNPEKKPLLYHGSDLVQFGRASDMRRYWDPMLFEERALCFENASVPPIGSCWRYSRVKLAPEQALTLRWLNRIGVECALEHASELTELKLKHWADCLNKHFCVLEWATSGVTFPQRFVQSHSVRSVLTCEDLEAVRRSGFQLWKCRVTQYVLQYLSARVLYATASARIQASFPGLHSQLRRLRDACGPLKRFMKARLS